MEIKKNSHTTVRTASKRTFLILFCIGFLILVAISAVCFYSFSNQKYHEKMIEKGDTATAEIYGYRYASGPMSGVHCVYKCVENGITYEGEWGPQMPSKEAEAYIGNQITIYIDGKGESFPVEDEPSTALTLTFSILITALALADFAGIIIFSIKIKNQKSK
ncbi:MAG: hypothetical protein K2M95_08075 [Clostridiales bacterium]|nr:hypothetical protein [Clostridiales bacterium]